MAAAKGKNSIGPNNMWEDALWNIGDIGDGSFVHFLTVNTITLRSTSEKLREYRCGGMSSVTKSLNE